MFTFFGHAERETLLQTAVLTAVATQAINPTGPLLLTHVVVRVCLTSPKETLYDRPAIRMIVWHTLITPACHI